MSQVIVRCIDCHICFVHNNKVKYLVLKRSSNKRYPLVWQSVTGKINPGEKPMDATLREVKEETGLSPLNLWAIDTVNYYYDPQENIMNLIPVFGMLVNTQSIKLSDEHQNYKWLNFEDAKNKLLWNNQKKGLSFFHDIITNVESQKNAILKII